ncbi:MAG: NUDIX domain-containing protein [Crocinitomicaceae bacterium]
MYKVFIDNVPKIYQQSSESELLDAFKSFKFIQAAGGLVEKNGKFLFIKRNGLWDIPKGKIEKGESVEEGAIREIEEECGIEEPKIITHLLDTWHTYNYKGKDVLKKTYWYYLASSGKKEELIPQEEEGITDVGYFSLDKLSEIEANTYISILEVIEKMRALKK